MATQITPVKYIEAFTKSVGVENIDTKKRAVNIPEGYNEEIYWKQLCNDNGLEYNNEAIKQKRSKACQTFEEMKFARSEFKTQITLEDGTEKHISELWLHPDQKNIKDALSELDPEETVMGKTIMEIVDNAATDEQKKSRLNEIVRKGIVQGEKKSSDVFKPFLAKEAYPELNPEKLFYPDGNRGRGRKSSSNKAAIFELM